MEIEIIDASEVDRFKDGKKADDEEEEEKPEAKLDILDDPVRMYLKQMGQVPLLTREQEVEISKRIEDAEIKVQKLINRFGFIARAYLDLAQKLIEGRERFDRVILDKKIESRERYMKALPQALRRSSIKQAEHCAAAYRHYAGARRQESRQPKSYHDFKKRTTPSSGFIRSFSSSRRSPRNSCISPTRRAALVTQWIEEVNKPKKTPRAELARQSPRVTRRSTTCASSRNSRCAPG